MTALDYARAGKMQMVQLGYDIRQQCRRCCDRKAKVRVAS